MLGDEWCHEMKPTGLEIDSQGGAASRNILSQDENKMSSIASLPSFRVRVVNTPIESFIFVVLSFIPASPDSVT